MILQLREESSKEGGNGSKKVCFKAPNGGPVVLTDGFAVGFDKPSKRPVCTEKKWLLDGIVQVVEKVQRKDDHRKECPRM